MPGRTWGAIALAVITVFGCGSSGGEVREVTPKDLLARGEDLLERQKYVNAIDELTQLSVDHPGVAFIDRVVYRLGEAYLGAEFYPDAEIQFARVTRDYPFSEFSDEAMYFSAETFYRQQGGIGNDASMSQAALRRFEIFLREFPESELAPTARARIQDIREFLALKKFKAAEQYFRLGRHDSVRIYCDLVIDEYPETDIAPDAFVLKARAFRELDDAAGACETLARLSQAPGDESDARARGRALAAEIGCDTVADSSAAPDE